MEGNVLLAEEKSCFDSSLGSNKSALWKSNLIVYVNKNLHCENSYYIVELGIMKALSLTVRVVCS
jgi:hypothetical protein